jgi:hypothetical protein
MPVRKLSLLTLGSLFFLGCGVSSAADLSQLPADENGWTFTVAPYLWASGISGESGLFGLPPQDVDVSFGDVLQNLDIGFMSVAEARNGRFFIGNDIVFAKLSTNVGTPNGILASDIDVDITTFMGTAIAGYSVVETETGRLDLFAGARLWSVDVDFDINNNAPPFPSSASDGDTWIDPMIGSKFKVEMGDGFSIAGWGMIGGFGVSSDFTWDVLGGVGYDVWDWISMFAGYRAVGVDYSRDGFVYDIVQDGPVFGSVLHF